MKKNLMHIIGLSTLVSLFLIGCSTSQPTSLKKIKTKSSQFLTENAVVENVHCLDAKCQAKNLTVYFPIENYSIIIYKKNNKKYQVGEKIIIKEYYKN